MEHKGRLYNKEDVQRICCIIDLLLRLFETKTIMKYLQIVLFALIPFVSLGQALEMKYNLETGGGEFQKVIEVPGKSANELYNLALRWVTKTFKNPESVLQAKLENEMLRGEGQQKDAVTISKTPSVLAILKYEFKIEVKDSKVRILIYNMKSISSSGSYNVETYIYKKDCSERTNSQATNIKESITLFITGLISSFEDSILEKEKATDKW